MPWLLKDELPGHKVATVQSEGWSGLLNGELLRLDSAAGFQALLTTDKGFEFQQNLSTLPITVVVLHSRTNRYEDLVPLMSEVLQRLESSTEHPYLLKIGN